MDPLVIPIVGMLIPIIIVPTAMGIKHARYLREVEHAERMRAMELGRPLAEDEAKWWASPAGRIGFGVPLGAMFTAFIASSNQKSADMIWIAAGMIGVAGVICGSILASMEMNRTFQSSAQPKPVYDPDEFDVVGSRG